MISGRASQSPIVQVLDAALGIQHEQGISTYLLSWNSLTIEVTQFISVEYVPVGF